MIKVEWKDSGGGKNFMQGDKKELARLIESLKEQGVDAKVTQVRAAKSDGSDESPNRAGTEKE